MITAEKTMAKITLGYGNGSGSFSYSGLKPEVSHVDAYMTSAGINAVQEQPAQTVTKTVESRLTFQEE